MGDRIHFFLNRLRERLWVRPLVACALSFAGAFLAKLADDTGLGDVVPGINPDSIETLLSILSSSMLVIATFSVASMVSAFAAAGSTATPRSFSLIVSDDESQNALSTFIGAFIFSIVSLLAMKNEYYGRAGHFALFALTLLVFALVILTFVRWVDQIARLGRLGTTIDKVEKAAAAALSRRRRSPRLGGGPVQPGYENGLVVPGPSIGYVQRIDVAALNAYAKETGTLITVNALPGVFSAPGRPVAYVSPESGDVPEIDTGRIARAFLVGHDRIFDEDPRFGLIVLSEIAGRALSPAVNDPGTAIDIIGRFLRLFSEWAAPTESQDGETAAILHDRVHIPEIAVKDLFDDAFTSIARDGAGSLEVAVRLQKSLASLAATENRALRDPALRHSRRALARAELALKLPEDMEIVRSVADFSAPV